MANDDPIEYSLASFNRGTAGNDSEHRFYTLTFPSGLGETIVGDHHFVFTETSTKDSNNFKTVHFYLEIAGCYPDFATITLPD